MKKQNFNLVEIIIAMGIVVVCITTIMGMFSVGMKVSRDAVRSAYAGLVVEQLGGLVTRYPNVAENIPESPSAIGNEASYVNAFKSTTANHWDTTACNDSKTIKQAEAACTTAIDLQDPFFKNVYYNESGVADEFLSLLKIEYQTNINSSDIVDFTLLARMWYETQAGVDDINVSEGADVQLDKKLQIEISWPQTDPYYNRILSGQFIRKSWVIYND